MTTADNTKATAPAVTKKTTLKPAATTAPSKAPTKSTTKPATKSSAKPVAKKAKAAPKPTAKPAEKPAKVKKPKMVRDSFTMPKAEFVVIDALKNRATQLKTAAKKTELIRAGVKALAAMSDSAFLAAIAAVPSLKTGRPAKS